MPQQRSVSTALLEVAMAAVQMLGSQGGKMWASGPFMSKYPRDNSEWPKSRKFMPASAGDSICSSHVWGKHHRRSGQLMSKTKSP